MAVISAYLAPDKINEAVELIESAGNLRVLAGGTDLLLKLRREQTEPCTVLSLKNISTLKLLEENKEGSCFIGSTVSLDSIEHSEFIREGFPALSEAAGSVGSPSLRVTATIGGNICNASPSADMAPPLMAYGASVVIHGGNGEREVLLEDFFTGPGSTVLEKGEILTGFRIPARDKAALSGFMKFGRVKAMDVATVNGAVFLIPGGKGCTSVRLVLGAVAATPIRIFEAEKLLEGQSYPFSPEVTAEAAEAAAEAAAPIDDIRASAQYRRNLVRVLVSRLLSGQKSNDGTEAAL